VRFSLRSIGPWLTIITLTAAVAAAAAGYGMTAPKRYRATAQLLVTPVPAGDATYTGLDLLRTGGKRSAAASAAALLRSPQVADAVRAQLGLARTRDSLLSSVDPHVVGDSDVLAITVEDTSPNVAAQLANAFADALVGQRTAGFQSQLATTIRRHTQLLRTTTGAGADELRRRLAVFRSLQGQPDPTLRVAAQASAPQSAAWPSLPRLVGVGAGLGLAAGVLVALLGLAARRGRRSMVPEGRAPERVVDELEARLLAKVETLVDARERLAAREAGLATREREVLAKIDELRAAAHQQPEASPDARLAAVTKGESPGRAGSAGSDSELGRREEELRARIAALAGREQAMARRAGDLARREKGLEERERELAEQVQPQSVQAGPVQAAGPADDGREELLAARVAVLTEREQALARRAGELARREKELDERERQPAEQEQGSEAAQPESHPAFDGARGHWNLISLERLVEQRGSDFPDRVDEWSSYLYFLREYADADGSVPAGFDWLIQDTFSELVA
jgi:hypothetical protein